MGTDQPDGTIGTLVYVSRKCCDCGTAEASWSADGARCHACWITHMDREQGRHWSDYLLGRVQADPEFRERLRAALGVTP